jgi:caffeoyl-CoA O-methyltransferase
MQFIIASAVSLFLSAGADQVAQNLDALLDQLSTYGREHRMLNVPPEHGKFLWSMAGATNAQRVLEIGTSDGYSTIWIARAVSETSGKIITLEIDEERHKEAVENFKKAGFDKIIDARLGDALKEIPKLEGQFDFIFIDAWKPDYIKYYQMVMPKLKPGGLMLAHNAVRSA